MTEKEDKHNASSSTVREQGNVSLACPKLNETNYTTWALLMETILRAYGLWETIDSEETVEEKKVHTTKAMIFQTLPQDVLMQVAQYTTAKEVWDSIKVQNLGADLVQKARLHTLRSEMETMKMKPNESVGDFAGKISSLKAKFRSLGCTLKDKVLVRKLLNAVPKKFLPIVATIEQYSDVDKMQFEEAVGRIIAFEERLKSQDEPDNTSEGRLMYANATDSQNWQRRGRGNQNTFRGRGRGGRGRGRSTSQSYDDKSNLKCYECGEYGHFAYECIKRKDKEKEKEEEAHLVWDDEEPTLL